MGYDTLKSGIEEILEAIGYAPSDQAFDFTDASAFEYGNTFILKALAGEMGSESETLADRFYDNENWQVSVAIKKSSQSDINNMNELHRKREEIIKKIDDPDSWRSFARIIKYQSWEVTDMESYFLLNIEVLVVDTIIY